jgi:hypothetical protein
MGGLDFLSGILTPRAFAVVSASPELLTTLVLVLISMSALCLLVWYIHFVTGKAYPKKKDDNAKPLWKKLRGKLGIGR